MTELTRIKKNLYVPEDFEKSHHYYADAEGKKEYTGITSIIGVLAKPALIQWAANEAVKYIRERVVETEDGLLEVISDPEIDEWDNFEQFLNNARTAHTRKKEAAGAHGTDAHALVEDYINQRIRGELPVVNAAIEPFVRWAIENVDHFLFSERRMADPQRFIAGTADFAYVGKDGKRYMADFKTSSGVYGIDYFLQVAGYRLLAQANRDKPYDGSVVVRLGKDGTFDVHYRYDWKTDKKAFLACLTLYRAQATFTKPKK